MSLQIRNEIAKFTQWLECIHLTCRSMRRRVMNPKAESVPTVPELGEGRHAQIWFKVKGKPRPGLQVAHETGDPKDV